MILVALVIGLGLWTTARPGPSQTAARSGDLSLYRAVVQRMRKGQAYEIAAIAEQRARHYPLRPFVVVRPPALAVTLSRLPDERTGDVILALLAAGVIAAWGIRLQSIHSGVLWLLGTALVIFTGVGATMGRNGASLFHESWAGVLIALSLALRTERRFMVAVVFGLLAALVRELAMPYLALMAGIALMERRRAEAFSFALALALALVLLLMHGHAEMALVGAADPASQGWVRFGGWDFVLRTAHWNLIALSGAGWAAAAIVPLSLLGACGWKSETGFRLTAILAAYTFGFMAIGRPENSYWGMLLAPLTAVGLCLAAASLADLTRRVFSGAVPSAQAGPACE
jgi:hypothetical protein